MSMASVSMPISQRARRDTLPEGADYTGHGYGYGCDVNPVRLGCLSCPLPVCRYDLPEDTPLRVLQSQQRAAIARRLAGRGLGIGEIADRLGVGERSVGRYLAA